MRNYRIVNKLTKTTNKR